jgi:uncharacterized membrane protein YoaK (UPF0700 family)
MAEESHAGSWRDALMTSQFADAWHTIVPAPDDPAGPLPPLLVALTVVTGLVDAFSYLTLGHVFTANVTGNIVFLGFALAGAPGFSVAASLTAYASFAAGSLLGGRLAVMFASHRQRLLSVAASAQVVLVAGATAVSASSGRDIGGADRYVLIFLLATAMGVQNAVARKLAVADLTTTVLTLTTTGIFADSRLVGGPGSKAGRRLTSIVAMFAGAIAGAVFVEHGQKTLALATALVLLAIVALLAGRWSRHQPLRFSAPA